VNRGFLLRKIGENKIITTSRSRSAPYPGRYALQPDPLLYAHGEGVTVGKITRHYMEEIQIRLKNKNKSKKITQKVLTHNTAGDIIKAQRQRNTKHLDN